MEQTAANPNHKWHVLFVVMIGTLMAALDSSIVNVSIPSMMANFGASVDNIEWVVTGYMLAFAASMPLTAWLHHKLGHKLLYTGSLTIFVAGSVLCAMSWSLPALIVSRVIQAIGGGAVTPAAMAMIAEAFEPRERGRAMGFWGVGIMIGPALGPTLGGYLTEYFGWRSIFLVNLPVGILGILLALHVLYSDRVRERKVEPFDIWGFLFLGTFLISILLGISKGQEDGWTSVFVLSCFAISIVGFVLFLLAESFVEHGIIDLKLFKSPVFTIAFILTAARPIALYGGVFLLPLFLEQVQGLDEIKSGLILLPGSIFIGMLMPIAGILTDKVGPKYLASFGVIMLALFMFMYRNLSIDMSSWDVIYPTLIRGFGIAFIMTPTTAAALNAVPTAKSTMASSMLGLIQQVCGSVGIAVLATVFSDRIHFHLAHMGADMSSMGPAFQQTLHHLSTRAHVLGYSWGSSAKIAGAMIMKAVVQQATVKAFQDAFVVGGGIVIVTLIPALFFPSRPVQRAHGEPIVME